MWWEEIGSGLRALAVIPNGEGGDEERWVALRDEEEMWSCTRR